MNSFFSKKEQKNPKPQGGESSLSIDEIMDVLSKEGYLGATVKPKLAIHPDWKIPEEDKYAFRFLNNEAPPMEANQLSLYGIQVNQPSEDRMDYIALIRHSVDDVLTLKKLHVKLIDRYDVVIAKKEFNLADAGMLPPKTSRPYIFTFERKDMLGKPEFPTEGWKLVIQEKEKKKTDHFLDLEGIEENMPLEEQKRFHEVVNKMGSPAIGQVKFVNFQAEYLEKTSDMNVTLLIRNGTKKNISIKHLPLVIFDNTEQAVAEAQFDFDTPIVVKANSTKPWTFHFGKETMLKHHPDLTRWKAAPPEKTDNN